MAVGRVVALGASNLTRGLGAVVSASRATFGSDVRILAALGHGRSYGARSRWCFRTLPGILDSGLWRALEEAPEKETRALITDVGNDILYGFPVEQILAWVDEAASRLQDYTKDIVLTDLPRAALRPLSRGKFWVFRSVLVPQCRLSRDEVWERVLAVNAGLAGLALKRDLRFFHLKPEWYGFDPIHIRPSDWRVAWNEILGTDPARGERGSMEGIGLYLRPPEKQWILGFEQSRAQADTKLPKGGYLRLY
jgi:hypothetical protein